MNEFDLTEKPARMLPRRDEIRKRVPHAVIGLVGICVIVYFAYHVIHGDRGLIAWQVLDRDVADAQAELAAVRSERIAIEHRVGLLRIESLDLDMLDEWSRRILNYGAADEAVIFTPDEDTERPRDEAPLGQGVPRDPDARVLGERR